MPVTPGSSYDPRVIFAALIAAGLATLVVTTLTVTNQIFTEQAAPAASSAGTTKLYADSTSHTLKASENTGTYSDVALVGRADTWTANQKFQSGKFFLFDTANDNTVSIVTAADEAADRTLTIPALGGNKTYALIDLAQTYSALQKSSIGWEFIGAAADATTTAQGVFDTSASLQTGYSQTSDAAFLRSVQFGTAWKPLHLVSSIVSMYPAGALGWKLDGSRNYGAANNAGGVNFGTSATQVQSWPGDDVGTVAPTTSPADTVQGWAANSAAANCNYFYRNELGTVKQITGLEQRRTATQTVTDSTTLTADDTLSIPVLAGAKYYFRLNYIFTTVNTSGVKVDMGGGTCTFTSFSGSGEILSLSGGTFGTCSEFTASTSTVALTASGTVAKVMVEGAFVVNAAGTFIPRFAQNAETGAAESVVAKTNSTLVLINTP